MKNKFLFAAFLVCLAFYANAGTRKVPQQYPTIQAAINAAIAGDTVLVSPGTYHENISFLGKGIVVASTFLTTNDTSFIRTTIINGSSPVYPDTASCVRITSKNSATYADTTAMLAGFTITGGTGTRWEDEHNMGSWYREGGGLLIQYLSPRIRFNHFIANQATSKVNCTSAGGGAIRCGDGNPAITNNIIDHNQGLYGAGLVFNYSGAIVKNNIISGNTGGQDFGGGGIWALGNEAHGKPRIVENNTIVNNSSVLSGGGIRAWSTTMIIKNNILWGNTSPLNPQVASVSATVTVTYCDVLGGYAGAGNMAALPGFESSAYYLSFLSPCIDKGDSVIACNDPFNPVIPTEAMFPAMGNLRNDIGAYGGMGSAFLGNINTVFTGTGNHGSGENRGIHMLQTTPNPCHDRVRVTFNLDDKREIFATLLSSAGNTVLSSEKTGYNAGFNAIVLDVSLLAPDTYILRINSDQDTIAAKIIKL